MPTICIIVIFHVSMDFNISCKQTYFSSHVYSFVDFSIVSEFDICINNTRKLAIVKFQIATQIINRIKKQQRVTNADIISNVGMKTEEIY